MYIKIESESIPNEHIEITTSKPETITSKQLFKAKKKLHDIELLEQKVKKGEKIDFQQQKKLETKPDVIELIKKLEKLDM